MDWHNFSERRHIKLENFVGFHGLQSREELLAYLVRRGIGPPPEEEIEALFPSVPKVIISTNEESKNVPVSSERVYREAYPSRGGDATLVGGSKGSNGGVRGQDRHQGTQGGNSNRKDQVSSG